MREKIKRKRGGKEREKGEKIIREKQERGGKERKGNSEERKLWERSTGGDLARP